MSLTRRVLNRARLELTAARWRWAGVVGDTTLARTPYGTFEVSTRDREIGWHLYAYRDCQNSEAARAVGFLRSRGLVPPRGKGCVLDVGANLGGISIGLLVTGEFESAIGVEPDPTNFGLLTRNVARNGLTGRYRAVNAAATDRAGSMRLSLDTPENLGNHRAAPDPIGSVRGARLDEVVKPGEVSLLWADVQGHESFALAGAGEVLSGVPAVLEVWPQGLGESGPGVAGFCDECRRHWRSFWVWRRGARYVRYSTDDLERFCRDELGTGGEFEDVVFTPG